jgi:hypothetical protein
MEIVGYYALDIHVNVRVEANPQRQRLWSYAKQQKHNGTE